MHDPFVAPKAKAIQRAADTLAARRYRFATEPASCSVSHLRPQRWKREQRGNHMK